jgi:hypothetical protein
MRRLIIPDPHFTPASAIYATDGTATGNVEERGIISSYPTPDPLNKGAMDLMPGGSREPWGDVEAEVAICRAGGVVVGTQKMWPLRAGAGWYWRRKDKQYWRGHESHRFTTQPIPIQIRAVIGSEPLRHCRVATMPNGKACLVYATCTAGAQPSDISWRIKSRIWDPSLQQWSIAYDVTGAGFSVDIAAADQGQGSDSPAPCIVCMPDGELICLFSCCPANHLTSYANFMVGYGCSVYSSYDGVTWMLKSRGWSSSVIPSNNLASDSALGVDGRDMVVLPSGRLVMVETQYYHQSAATPGIGSWVSDDRGITWSARYDVDAAAAAFQVGAIMRIPTIEVTHSGIIIGHLPNTDAGGLVGTVPFFSLDGVTWGRYTPGADWPVGGSAGSCLDSDGFLTLATVLGEDTCATAILQGLMVHTARRRDYDWATLSAECVIPQYNSTCLPNDGIDDSMDFRYVDPFLDADGSLQYVVIGRGAHYSSMVGIRGHAWCDLRCWHMAYAFGGGAGADSGNPWYNAASGSWWNFDFPNNAEAGSVVAANVCDELGLKIVDNGANTDRYSLYTGAGNNPSFEKGILWRIIAYVESGGGYNNDNVVAKLVATDNHAAPANYVEVNLRLGTTSFQFYDVRAAGALGARTTITAGVWIEFVITVSPTRDFQAWYREIEPDRDAEFIQVLTLPAVIAQAGVPDPNSYWGHAAGANAVSWWLEIAAAEGYQGVTGTTLITNAERFALPHEWPAVGADLLIGGAPSFGVAGLATPEPQSITGGTGVAWSGANGHPGDLWTGVGARYEHGRVNPPQAPPHLELRSRNCGDWCVVFDAGEGMHFVVDAVAAVGVNFSRWRYQMNDADLWVAPAVDFQGSDAGATFDTSAYSDDGTNAFTVSTLEGDNVIATASKWRAHQYVDQEKRCWYLRMTSGQASGKIWRIRDNDTGRILLYSEPVGVVAADTFCIFADRVAFPLDAEYRYRFIRVHLDDADNLPNTVGERFYRLGTLVPGLAWDFDPEFDWGFTPSWTPRVSVAEAPGGARSVKHVGPSREAIDVTFDGLPHAATDPADVVGPWQVVVDLMERLQYGVGHVAFLPYDYVTIGAKDRSDDLWIARIMGAVGGQHVAYVPIKTSCDTGWILNLAGLRIEEEL